MMSSFSQEKLQEIQEIASRNALKRLLEECRDRRTSGRSIDSHFISEALQEYEKKHKQIKNQLQQMIQLKLGNLEKGNYMVKCSETCRSINKNLDKILQHSTKISSDIHEYEKIKALNVAKRNLSAIRSQYLFSCSIPSETDECLAEIESYAHDEGELSVLFHRWIKLEEWKFDLYSAMQKSLLASLTNERESREMVEKLRSVLGTRVEKINRLALAIKDEIWKTLENCVEVIQHSVELLTECFELIRKMQEYEKEMTAKIAAAVPLPLDFKEPVREFMLELKPSIFEVHSSMPNTLKAVALHRIKSRMVEANKDTTTEEENSSDLLHSVLEVATNSLMELSVIQEDIAPLAGESLPILRVFSSIFHQVLEEKLLEFCTRGENELAPLSIADQLQLMEWIDYYLTEVVRFNNEIAVGALKEGVDTLFNGYLSQIKDQMSEWMSNIFSREDEVDKRRSTQMDEDAELSTSTPEDLINIFSNQVSVASCRLEGHRLAAVVKICTQLSIEFYKTRLQDLLARVQQLLHGVEVEEICYTVNDIDRLQTKIPDLTEDLGEKVSSDDLEQLNDDIYADVSGLVKVAVSFTHLIVERMLQDVSDEGILKLFTPAWMEDKGLVVKGCLVTFEDYFQDFQRWICGAFFIQKVVKETLDKFVERYHIQLLSHRFDEDEMLTVGDYIQTDYQAILEYFSAYVDELKQCGIRSQTDLELYVGHSFHNIIAFFQHEPQYESSSSPTTASRLRSTNVITTEQLQTLVGRQLPSAINVRQSVGTRGGNLVAARESISASLNKKTMYGVSKTQLLARNVTNVWKTAVKSTRSSLARDTRQNSHDGEKQGKTTGENESPRNAMPRRATHFPRNPFASSDTKRSSPSQYPSKKPFADKTPGLTVGGNETKEISSCTETKKNTLSGNRIPPEGNPFSPQLGSPLSSTVEATTESIHEASLSTFLSEVPVQPQQGGAARTFQPLSPTNPFACPPESAKLPTKARNPFT